MGIIIDKCDYCKKDLLQAGRKLCDLLRLSPFLITNKRRIIYTSTVKSQLNYYPLLTRSHFQLMFQFSFKGVWKWNGLTKLKNGWKWVNKVQDRSLWITYSDQLSDFKTLLSKQWKFLYIKGICKIYKQNYVK